MLYYVNTAMGFIASKGIGEPYTYDIRYAKPYPNFPAADQDGKDRMHLMPNGRKYYAVLLAGF